MGSKKRSKFGLLWRKVFKKANIGALILSLIDLSSILEDDKVKSMFVELKKDVKENKIIINAENAKDFLYIASMMGSEGVSDVADALREVEKLAEEYED